MRKITNSGFLLIGLFFSFQVSFATHQRAGEITYQKKPGFFNWYIVTVVTYTYSGSPVDKDSMEVSWGDNTSGVIPRVNKIFVGNETYKNVYIGEHQYNSGWTYTVSILDPNRMAGIINIKNTTGSPNNPASQEVPLYLESQLSTISFCGAPNNSPVLLQPPIDYANKNEIFTHNPNAYDPDGDSLSYELMVPLQAPGVGVDNYQFPDSVYSGIDDAFTINPQTGEITWNTPKIAGIYNIAIKIHEYRRCGNRVFEVGYIIRDMQIIVKDVVNNPPVIPDLKDTCVVAGDYISVYVFATDPDVGQKITLTGAGGPLELSANAAVFDSVQGYGTISSEFKWQTVCDHIRKSPWMVVFKAADNFTQSPLADLETWLIRVVGPPPQNLQATAVGNDIQLIWDSLYQCATTGKFKGFSIWRREGSNPFVPDTCETGLAGRGYVKIADTVKIYSYLDKNLDRGKLYCYRILAVFAEGSNTNPYNIVESIPSNEDCAELKLDVPIITNVNVTKTDVASGEIFLKWKKPRADALNLDTLQSPPPYRYEIYRSTGMTGSNPVLIKTITANAFYQLTDSTLLDGGLNTVSNAYSYRIDFYSNNIYLGNTGTASSVFLSIKSDDKKLHLSWTFDVPWENYAYVVYRYDTPSLSYLVLDTVAVPQYTDTGLVNKRQYCYFVRTIGRYSDPNITDTLLNDSQEACDIPQDTIPPCPPVLTVNNYCDTNPEEDWLPSNFPNKLYWVMPQSPCAADVVRYRIYYAPKADTVLSLIDSTFSRTDTSYVHTKLFNTLAGCYAVTALDSFDNESAFSNMVCVDNCPLYDLPNVFTPNGDGRNDFFTPFEFLDSKNYAARFIDHVDMKIFNRWGQLVFKTSDPLIRWDGKDYRLGEDLAEGVYFYICDIYEIRLQGVIKREEPKASYIHILR